MLDIDFDRAHKGRNMQPDNQTDDRAAAVRAFRPLAELIPAHWHTGTITLPDDLVMHYTRTGTDTEKTPLILLHGVQVAGLMWLRTAGALEGDYDVIMPDLRAHGHTDGLEHGLSTDQTAGDMQWLIQSLGLDTPFVMGHSMGADVAGRLAGIAPLRAAILVDPALQNFAAMMPPLDMDDPPEWLQAILDTMRDLKTLPHAERMAQGLRLLPPGIAIWDELDYVPFVEGQAQFDPAAFPHLLTLGYLVEDTAALAAIACPTLLLTARPMMPQANIDAGIAVFEQHVQSLEHEHFADSGHFIPFDQFQRFVTVVTEFLRAN
jgi:pimeloyl-ACP methyl ester carboxylesterase